MNDGSDEFGEQRHGEKEKEEDEGKAVDNLVADAVDRRVCAVIEGKQLIEIAGLRSYGQSNDRDDCIVQYT